MWLLPVVVHTYIYTLTCILHVNDFDDSSDDDDDDDDGSDDDDDDDSSDDDDNGHDNDGYE